MACRYFNLGLLAIMATAEVVTVNFNAVDDLELTQAGQAKIVIPSLQALEAHDTEKSNTHLPAAVPIQQDQCFNCGNPGVKRDESNDSDKQAVGVVSTEKSMPVATDLVSGVEAKMPYPADNAVQQVYLALPTNSAPMNKVAASIAATEDSDKVLSTPTIAKRLLPPSGYSTVTRPGMMTSAMLPAQSSASWSLISALASEAKSESLRASSMASALNHKTGAASQMATRPSSWVAIGCLTAAAASLALAIYL